MNRTLISSNFDQHNGSHSASPFPYQNQLLAVLPEDIFESLHSSLELVSMRLGDVIYESGCPIRHVYFPTTSIISLLHILEDGQTTEIAMAGNKGMVGVQTFMGGISMPNRAVVQNGGYAYRLSRDIFMREFGRSGGRRSGALQHLLLRYTQALLTQIAQTSVCYRHHSVSQQMCRWLLLRLDRSTTNTLVVTQELIGEMLGVRREAITAAAGQLRSAGLINYNRGHLTVLDRPQLEATACECYGVVKSEFDRLLPDLIASEANSTRSGQACHKGFDATLIELR